ncbi:hypothetical protein CSHISOI_02864, partial [Colletotrichum shisoi]
CATPAPETRTRTVFHRAWIRNQAFATSKSPLARPMASEESCCEFLKMPATKLEGPRGRPLDSGVTPWVFFSSFFLCFLLSFPLPSQGIRIFALDCLILISLA